MNNTVGERQGKCVVYIEIEEKELTVICNCHIGTKNGKQFRMIIDKKTKEFIEKPEYNINVSAAYSCIFHLLDSGKLRRRSL